MTNPGKTPTPVRLSIRYRDFRQGVRHLWETYSLIQAYAPAIRKEVKAGRWPTLRVVPLQDKQPKDLGAPGTYGTLDYLTTKANPRRILIDAASAFEDFLGDMATLVYADFPGKLLRQAQDDSPEYEEKLLRVIISSVDREEILERVTEEYLRGVFYKNPTEFFLKDRAKLEFGSYFTDKCKAKIDQYAEMTARRNLLVHNGGRVDRKYKREVPASGLRLGQVAPLESDYLHDSLALLEGLGAAATGLVLSNVYKQKPRGKVALAWAAFKRSL